MRETAKKIDRRTARTQAALREALVRLLRRKDYADITIQEILDEANVGRSTFYSHCSGKDQLLRLSLRLLRSELLAVQQSATAASQARAERPLAFSLPVLMHLAEHRDLYPSLARGAGHDLFMSEIRQLVLELAKVDLASFPKNDGIPHEVFLQFVVGSFMALVAWWLERKATAAPAILNEMFQQLALYGISQRNAPKSSHARR